MKNRRIFLMIVHGIYYFLREPKFWLTAIKSLIKRCGKRTKPLRDSASTHNDDKNGYRSKQRAIEEIKTWCKNCIWYEKPKQCEDCIYLETLEEYYMQNAGED